MFLKIINRNNKRYGYSGLTDGEIQERIERIKKNCFTLELQNEVIENYLRTHDPSAIRGSSSVKEMILFI